MKKRFCMLLSKFKSIFLVVLVPPVIAIIIDVMYMDNERRKAATVQQNIPVIERREYKEIVHPTPNFDKERKNKVIGVVLHHTAEPTVEKSLEILSSPKKKVGTHVVIDTDGTRYLMADPEVATYHAGWSVLNGQEGCNYCTVGIEFQGNTLVEPLTEDQIASSIEYLLPIIARYNIPLENVVTHEMVRTAYKQKYPQKRCSGKVDITQTEYLRFMKYLRQAWDNYKDAY